MMVGSPVSPEEFNEAYDIVTTALQDIAGADGHLPSGLAKARAILATAGEELASGNFAGPTFKIANAAKLAAEQHYAETDPGRARLLFEWAIRLYEARNPERYHSSIDECQKGLLQLGPALRVREESPAADTTEAVEGDADTAETEPESPVSPPRARVPGQIRVPVAAGQAALGLFDRWRSDQPWRESFSKLYSGFEKWLVECLTRHAPDAAEVLRPLVDADLKMLAEGLAPIRVPADEYWPLHEGAMTVRNAARTAMRNYMAGGTASEAQQIRNRFLQSALLNFCLREHLKSNNYQVVADVVGYLQIIQAEHRRNSDQRELLLAAAEATTLVAVSELQDVDLELRLPDVCRWLRHAVGIQLLIGGPDPVDPEYSNQDQRVRGVTTAEGWATHLLDEWANAPEHRHSTAFMLLSLSGWKENQLDRLLTGLYHNPHEEPSARYRDVRRLWRGRAVGLLDKARDVSVVKNAWEPGTAAEATASMSLTERDQTLQLPNRLLQGVAAELAPRHGGLMVQGALFAGRPVPTFLARNVFGPVGVLKMDEESKVQREKRNFDEFGEQLQPFYRSSKCTVSSTSIVNRSNGSRYQAILTSYVFREDDEPSTFRDWLTRREPVGDETLRGVVRKLFVKALGPWLSNASRAVGDLRGEYPALRPAGFERAGYRPGKNAESELRKFASPEVGTVFGVPDGLAWRPRSLGELLGEHLDVGGLEAADRKRTSPLWLVAQIAEVAVPSPESARLVDWLLYDREHGLTTRYLTCVSHGDLHCENILTSGPDASTPHLYVIDFETTHRGHIAKDFARLEAALWSRTFPWATEQVRVIREWFAASLRPDRLWNPVVPEGVDDSVRRVLTCVIELRSILKGCEQSNWAFNDLEYQWALLASLLPFARYRDHEDLVNRWLPFFLAADVADALVSRAREATEGTETEETAGGGKKTRSGAGS
ncbi:phosphotransferase [Streptomyces sp. NPDC101490]|uniref:phosphotransferase n=1 Tax=Streptomyces sp. NPDC101490 TaxID=3366143 RepID=UPI00380E28F5